MQNQCPKIDDTQLIQYSLFSDIPDFFTSSPEVKPELSELDKIDTEYKKMQKQGWMSTEVPKPQKIVDSELVESESEIQDPFEIEKVYQKEETQNQALKDSEKVIHILPHSHTDLGWLYTVDEYFSDNKRTGWFRGSVQVMLNSVMNQLK